MADSRCSAAMRAVVCVDNSSNTRLELRELPRPALPDGHVRVAVHYCSMGVADLLILTGKYQVRPPLPFVPGSEVAGLVTEVAPGVKHVRVGDRVAGLNYAFAGGLAEESVMPAALAVRVPEKMSLRAASAMLVNYATAYYGLRDRGNVRPGERVLVLGAAGGVGLATVEIAKAMGAHVIAAASSAEKLAHAKQHGADECLNYTKVSLKDELKAAGGIDVVMDPVGGIYSEPALRCLRPGGRLLVVGFAAGEIPRIALNLPLLKDCSIVGAFLSTQTHKRPADFVANMTELFDMYTQGDLAPVVRELSCFTEYESALRQIADRNGLGKVTLRVTSRVEEHDTDTQRTKVRRARFETAALAGAP